MITILTAFSAFLDTGIFLAAAFLTGAFFFGFSSSASDSSASSETSASPLEKSSPDSSSFSVCSEYHRRIVVVNLDTEKYVPSSWEHAS